MDNELTNNIIILAVGFFLSIISSLIGMKIQKAITLRNERRPLRQLLNFGRDEVIIIFPHRDTAPEAIIPRTSTEDFLAMNNFISALLSVGWNNKIIMKDAERVKEKDHIKNLVIICSAKTNMFARKFQKILNTNYPEAFTFHYDDSIA